MKKILSHTICCLVFLIIGAPWAGATVNLSGSGFGTVTSSPVGIDCEGDCGEAFDHNSDVTLTAAPDIGSLFSNWSEDCSGTETEITTTADSDKNCTATFEVPYSLTVNRDGHGTGTVTSSPNGIDCGGNCVNDFVSNSDVTLTAAPDAMSTFNGWSGDCSGTDTEIAVTMNGDKTCTATFEVAPSINSLTVSKDGSGTGTVNSSPDGIDCGGDCANDFASDSDVILTATPDDGSALHGWSGVDCPGNGDCKVTMDRDLAVTATFNTDSDGDGISDDMENGGPNNGDGNNDGILDSEQGDVATFLNIKDTWITMIADGGKLKQVTATNNPSPGDSPSEADFNQGFFGFKVTGLASGASAEVTLFLHTTDTSLAKYYRYGPTSSDNSDHWYKFDYDNTTGLGARFIKNNKNITIILHMKDGGLGDDDLTANGEIVDVGAPYAYKSTGGGGGGGCFFNLAY